VVPATVSAAPASRSRLRVNARWAAGAGHAREASQMSDSQFGCLTSFALNQSGRRDLNPRPGIPLRCGKCRHIVQAPDPVAGGLNGARKSLTTLGREGGSSVVSHPTATAADSIAAVWHVSGLQDRADLGLRKGDPYVLNAHMDGNPRIFAHRVRPDCPPTKSSEILAHAH
jgi:hypothetical protein